MKPKGFIHTLVLVLVTGAMIMPTTGCFGDEKGFDRSDDEVFGATFGGFWGVGTVVGGFVQYSPLRLLYAQSRLQMGNEMESRTLDVELEGSVIGYVAERDLTVVLLHDDVNDVTFELAVPGRESGRYTLPAGELDAPWLAIDIDGARYTTSDNAQVVVDLKAYPEVGDALAGTYRGHVEAEDGTLVEVQGSFEGTRVQ